MSTLLGTMLIAGCGGPSDQKAYEEVLTTMSMAKAKDFFKAHPRSPYRDRLVNDLIEWCRREGTETCYRLIIETVPKDHMRHKELAAYYEKTFGVKR